MARPWLPNVVIGPVSGEMIDRRRCEGRYIQIDWLGFVLVIEISRVIARTVFTERPPLGDWPHISDDMKHGERLRHD